MINRILHRSKLVIMSDGIATLSETPCSTVTFKDSPALTQQKLLALGYSPPLEMSVIYSGGRPLIGGETACYCSHLFFTYYEGESNGNDQNW
jgi:hypothetical protein